MDQFKEKFLDEAKELISKIENALIDLEAHPDNEENINEIFRAMHTLKGTSVMFGFVSIGELTHFTESIFDKIREGEMDLSKDIVEFTLESVDHIRNLLSDQDLLKENNKTNQDRLLRSIQQMLKLSDSSANKKQKKEQKVKNPKTIYTYYIAFEPDEKLMDRGISILSLFAELATIGNYRIVNLTPYKDTESKKENWGVYLSSSSPINDIKDVFIFVEENVKIVKISDKNLLEEEQFNKLLEKIEQAENEDIVKEVTALIQNEKENNKVNKEIKLEVNDIEDTTLDKQKSSKEKIQQSIENLANEVTEKISGNSRIQVDSAKLDVLMYLVSELVTTKARLRLLEQSGDYSQLAPVVEKIEDLSKQFRDNVLEIRLVPVLDMLIPFKRLIRDVSKKLEKKVTLVTEGVDTELDKNIIDKLGDPLMHIIRNSIDHGIESPEDRIKAGKPEEGTIKLSSYYAGSNVIIKIEDDGRGLNADKIRKKAIDKGLIEENQEIEEKELFELLFHPGFSTAEEVTDLSGRGVGMDVVKRVISEVRGDVFLSSELGKGTTTIIKLKQTISITDSLLVKVAESHFLVPLSDIEFCDQKTHEELHKTNNTRVELGDELIPFISIRDQFNTGGDHPQKAKLVIVSQDNKRVALIVDSIIGEHQAVLKPLGDIFENQEYLSGASVLGDGNLALMLDTSLLIEYTHEKNKLVS